MAVGCYVPKYRPFSFKGVPAIDMEVGYEGGRRGAEGEFPFGEVSAYADLGRKIRRFNVRCAFRENSHLADAKRFFDACESPGPGTLVHPSYGSVRAAVKSIKIRDNRESDQGETTADIEFVEANSIFAGASLGALLNGLAIGPVINALQQSFLVAFNPLASPLTAVVSGLASDMIGHVQRELIGVGGIRDDDTGYWRTVQELGGIASDPLRAQKADTAWLGLAGGFAAIDQYGTTAQQKTAAYRNLANRAATMPRTVAGSVVAQEAVIATARVLAATYMVRAALEEQLQTMQEGFTQYDRIMTVLEGEADIAYRGCDNGLHLTLRDLIVNAQTALLNRTYQLPAIVTYQFHASVFSLVAAHEIYGDARQFATVEKFNAGSGGMQWFVGPAVYAPRATPGSL